MKGRYVNGMDILLLTVCQEQISVYPQMSLLRDKNFKHFIDSVSYGYINNI